jgi:ribosomal protein L11 methylase PrmA
VPALLREGGRYIATGLLETSEQAVAGRLAETGLAVQRADHLEGWACLTLERSI